MLVPRSHSHLMRCSGRWFGFNRLGRIQLWQRALRPILRYREGEDKGGPMAGRALGPDVPTMRSNDGIGDSQPQASADGRSRRRPGQLHMLHTIELVEDRPQLVWRDAHALILDAHL